MPNVYNGDIRKRRSESRVPLLYKLTQISEVTSHDLQSVAKQTQEAPSVPDVVQSDVWICKP